MSWGTFDTNLFIYNMFKYKKTHIARLSGNNLLIIQIILNLKTPAEIGHNENE